MALHRRIGSADLGHRADGSLDVRLPGFDRRLAVGAEPRDLPADRRLAARRHGRHRADCPAGHGLRALAVQPADADGQLPDAHPLAGASLPAQAVDEFLSGRVRRPHRHQADADGAGRARMHHQAVRRAELRLGLFPRHAVHRRLGRLAACRAARRVAGQLRPAAELLHPAARQGGRAAGGCSAR